MCQKVVNLHTVAEECCTIGNFLKTTTKMTICHYTSFLTQFLSSSNDVLLDQDPSEMTCKVPFFPTAAEAIKKSSDKNHCVLAINNYCMQSGMSQNAKPRGQARAALLNEMHPSLIQIGAIYLRFADFQKLQLASSNRSALVESTTKMRQLVPRV